MSTRESTELRRELDRLTRDLASVRTESDLVTEGYRAILENSSDGIWRLEFDRPIPVRLSEDQQVEMILAGGWLAEANQRLAEMYGYRNPSQLVGARLSGLLGPTSDSILDCLRTFIRSGYRMQDLESRQTGNHGTERYFVSTLSGIIQNGLLVRVWGSQRDVTREKLVKRQFRQISEDSQAALEREQAGRREAEGARDLQQQVQEQVSLLTEASSMLLKSLTRSEVLETILSLARRFVAADGYALWRVDEHGKWKIVAAVGLSREYQKTLLDSSGKWSGPPNNPVIIENVETSDVPTIRERVAQFRAERIRSLFSIPLRIRDEGTGFITFYYRVDHRPSEGEIRVGTALANLAAAAIATSELYEEQTRMRAEAEQAQQRSEFLAEASSVLASSLDYEKTLATVANLSVPRLADWCAVDIAIADGEFRRLAVAHSDPSRVKLAMELAKRYPPRPDDVVPRVLRSGVAQMSRQIPESSLERVARDVDHLAILKQLGLQSYMAVPLIAREKILGVISFVTAESGRCYDEASLKLAEELAHRAALAVDSAQLYAAAQQQASEAEAALTALKQSNEDLQQFAYVASHDLQEPLRTIASYTQLLERRYRLQLDEQADEFIAFIVGAARRMSDLIQDLLAYSRAANAPERTPYQRVPMNEVFRAVQINLKAAISDSGATVTAGELPVVKADPAQMVQLLQNLISNGIKYRGETAPEISVSAEQADGHWRFTVQDSGIGIEPQYWERIFGIFKRLHGSKYPGTGVGLAICRRIVERHGGKIWVASSGDSGSQFKFTLPAD
jgi:signal transduction histidine kinase